MMGMLRHTADIQRSTPAKSSSGSVSDGWATVGSGIPCRIQPLGGEERLEQQGEVVIATHRGYFLPTVDIQLGDRVIARGVTHLVTFVAKPRGHHIETDLTQIT